MLGNAIMVPYINRDALALQMQVWGTGLLGLYNVMSGGAFATATVFALSIQPYINSSIIIQLLTVAIPALERLARDGGEEGKKKIQSITRYATVAIAILQAVGYYFMMKNYNLLESGRHLARTGHHRDIDRRFLLRDVDGRAGHRVRCGQRYLHHSVRRYPVPDPQHGLRHDGRCPEVVRHQGRHHDAEILTSAGYTETQAQAYLNGALAPWGIVLLVVGMLALIAFIVFINDAERRIPVQYAKRQVGRKMYGGQSSTLPMKVNMSGVLPIIFAQSIASLPITIWTFIGMPKEGTVSYSIYDAIDTKSVIYMVVYFIMIIGFSYFYSSIQFNPVEIANNLKKQGGFIPGFRPGKPTVQFIQKVLSRITLFGAIYLGIVAICPLMLGKVIGNSSLAIGGTSVIIVVGVALETVKALENQMLMRQYKGFLE